MLHYWIDNHLGFIQFAPLFFFISILVFLLIGWSYGKYRLRKYGNVVLRDSLASAIFGLSALVLGFTFSNANDHFDQRMSHIRDQADIIEQVYQSTSYLNSVDRIAAQNSLKKLLEIRLSVYVNVDTANILNSNLDLLSKQLNKVNEDILLSIPRAPANTRDLADKILRVQLSHLVNAFHVGILNAKNHPPAIIERFLLILLSIGSLLSGYAMAVQKEEDWFLTVLYLGLMGFTLFVIFSLEFPNQLFSYEVVNSEFLRFQRSLE
jgi:hypothetical protein